MTPIKLPTAYDDDILAYERGCDPDGTAMRPHVYSLVYPPIGFFPFYGLGNGDYHGYYWPIGREDGPPLVAFSSHDVGSLIPEHSDIEALYRCQLARAGDEAESNVAYAGLAATAMGRAPVTHTVRGVKSDDFCALLALDSTSPYYLCAAADVDVARNQIDAAECRYRQALELLPEYVAAHFGLAAILRRQRRNEEATLHLRRTLIGPLALYGGSFWADTALPGAFRNDWARKSLLWLQQSKAVHKTLEGDPFIKIIHVLTFKDGLANNSDFEVLQTVVDEYALAGNYAEGARVWQLIGERAAVETTPFRERLGLNASRYGRRLAELYDLSGNGLRAALVRNMLEMMQKPDGFRL